ncbi:hypothetical protein PLICRDRAFT_118583 [Plicaturopsis crispa FD-325 SS-3]|uniref:Xylanolytic transcriptional activator regulatory domain-containing protein n=1 Tax=Plicaturopsis crispa FD-325 SS-3 TaxID=944288 RepID=A0A0C9SX89_PLICR|nr:hypothetical protein PLICRDRAFT_118583 [Plicaturopsis crispa FD-325 SS-3]
MKREQYITEPHDFLLPDADLLTALVDLYFTRLNAYFPILHRPTFSRGLADGLHLRDKSFGSLVLLVCALGSRYSTDPRVFLGYEHELDSAGRIWFDQVQTLQSIYAPPSPYELQLICLSIIFLQATSAPRGAWTLIGIGVRLAIDMGVHRQKASNNIEDELRKRAFWVLVCFDTAASSGLGRPCAVHDDDFDLDFPENCDDEYWESTDGAEQNFKQPPGKLAETAWFISFLKLNKILVLALRTIASPSSHGIFLSFLTSNSQWEQKIVVELDSALNRWLEQVPDHLRWDPTREDELFFNQSASLYSSYYYVQILVHRPFIPSPHKVSPLSLPSLAICTNAARSCIRMVIRQYDRFPDSSSIQFSLVRLFSSCVVLLLNARDDKQSGPSINSIQAMSSVHKCMDILKSLEERWNGAGRLWYVLGNP